MTSLIITLLIITAILLILVTALQSAKKEGVSNGLGNTGVYQIIGVKKTSDLLEQITWGLIIALFSLSLFHSLLLKKRNANPSLSPNLERFQGQQLPSTPQQPDQEIPSPENHPSDTTLTK